MHVVLARPGEKPGRAIGATNRSGKRTQNRVKAFRVGARCLSRILGAAQFCSRDHLHGLRDLARGFHARDPVFKNFEVGH